MTAPTEGWRKAGTPIRGPAAWLLGAGAIAFHVLSLRWLRAPGWRNKTEARQELQRLVSEHAAVHYDAWANRIGQLDRLEFTSATGTWYQATIEPVWDDKAGGAIRVLFAIDDGGVGAYYPLTESVLLSASVR